MSQFNKSSHVILYVFIVLCCVYHSIAGNKDLDSSNWHSILSGEWLIKFYAPWCPACRSLQPTWEELAQWADEQETLSIGSVDVTLQPGLNGRFMITALPTIYHVKDGVFRQYKNSRSLEDLKNLIIKEEWKEIMPVSDWLSPTSTIMSGMGKLFDFSIKLKEFQETMTNDYGFPSWIVLLLFGLVVIIIGLLLGVGLVVATDYIWGPPKPYAYPPPPPQSSEEKGDDDVKQNEDKKSSDEGGESSSEEVIAEDGEEHELNLRKRNVKKNQQLEEET